MITTPFPTGLPSGAAASQAKPGISEPLTPHPNAPVRPSPAAHLLALWPRMLPASFLSFQTPLPPPPPALKVFAHPHLLLTRYFWDSLLYARPGLDFIATVGDMWPLL